MFPPRTLTDARFGQPSNVLSLSATSDANSSETEPSDVQRANAPSEETNADPLISSFERSLFSNAYSFTVTISPLNSKFMPEPLPYIARGISVSAPPRAANEVTGAPVNA